MTAEHVPCLPSHRPGPVTVSPESIDTAIHALEAARRAGWATAIAAQDQLRQVLRELDEMLPLLHAYALGRLDIIEKLEAMQRQILDTLSQTAPR